MNIIEQLLDGVDLKELRELKGFSRYLVDIEQGRVLDKETGEFKRNTANAQGYVYHTLRSDDNKSITLSMHQIVMAAALEVSVNWWKRFNLVIDHRNNKKSDNSILNLALITQSENIKKRENIKPYKRFSEEELIELQHNFKYLDEVVHGEIMDTYAKLADRYDCSPQTIQVKYLDWKKAQ